MMALTVDWADTFVKLLAGGAGTAGIAVWLRRRLGKESVLRKSFVAAMRTAFTESVSPELSIQLDDTRSSIVDLTNAVSKLSNGQTELKTDVAMVKTDVAMVKTDVANVGEKVTTFGERLVQHLEWEERERKSDIAHRKRASVQRREQFAEVATRLDALDARMATVEHAAQ